jgi:translocation and assembly module TamA
MNLNLVAGRPLNHGIYNTAKRRLSDLARDRGYAEADYAVSRVDVYPEEGVADIELEFDSGPRYRLGAVGLEQDALNDTFVRSYVALQSGEFFNNQALTDTYVALNDSGYFQNIDVRAQPPDAEAKTIDVVITLSTAPRRLISYGVGFSTDTGPRLRFGRNIRRWNERGHQLGLDAQLSPVISEVSANYRLPYGDPRFDWLSFSTGLKHEETETATSDSLEFGARRITERSGGWATTQYLSLLVEDFEVGDQFGRSRLLMPGMNWTRLRADHTLRPTRGSKFEFEARGGADALGSDTDFVQLITSVRWITSFGGGKRVLLRGQFGATAEDRFEKLPPSVRFFAGGDNSVRGYEFQSLGPVDAAGQVIGGSRLAVVSAEVEFPVRPRWSVALFVDSGNAFNGKKIDARTGAGIGARWQSPLGPVRVDIGAPVNDPDHSPRLHVSLGPDL